jgi:hypothetical protein
MDAPDVWVAKDDSSDIVRARAIIGVGIDYNGHITAQLGHSERTTVTLVAPGPHHGHDMPDDFHRQLIRLLAQLSDASSAFLVRPVCEEPGGWRWHTEPL